MQNAKAAKLLLCAKKRQPQSICVHDIRVCVCVFKFVCYCFQNSEEQPLQQQQQQKQQRQSKKHTEQVEKKNS